ncbi:MAG: signal peptidase II [Candidatus Woesearchaeota archaeon]|nr:signal peptidase II [Candidatus Woesearchaeota archaeon]
MKRRKFFFSRNRFLIFSLIALAVIIADRILKGIIMEMLPFESFPLIGEIVYINFVQNTGGGFGILKGSSAVITWLSVILLGMILYFYDSLKERMRTLASSALIFGGVCGNLIDRYSYGFVADFIDFRFFPVFNLADSAITIGAILLAFFMLFPEKRRGKNNKKNKKKR